MASDLFCSGSNRRRLSSLPGLLLMAAILFISLAACKTDSGSESAAQLIPSEPIVTKSLVPPPVIITVIYPQDRQSFRPLSQVDLAATATGEAATILEPGSLTETAPTETPLLPPTPSPTPLPTFTPPALPQTSPGEHYWLRRPVPEGSAVWTDKVYPYGSNRNGALRTHHGVEFNVPAGTDVLAAASGTAIIAGQDDEELLGAIKDFYGNVVVIQHDSGLGSQPVYSLYGHLSEILVSVGQNVHAQDIIARSGASGVADGAHLHFEVRLGENSYASTQNPLLWLYPFPDRGVVAGLVSSASGQPIPGYPLSLRRIDASSPYAGGTTYADNSVNPDEAWQENFVFDDVAGGYYELSAGTGEDKEKVEFWVYPYQTSFIQLIIAE